MTSYKDATYVSQSRRSNPKGFADWISDMPMTALPGLTPDLRKGLNPYSGSFDEVPNRRHVWRKSFNIGGSELVVIAIQTED